MSQPKKGDEGRKEGKNLFLGALKSSSSYASGNRKSNGDANSKACYFCR